MTKREIVPARRAREIVRCPWVGNDVEYARYHDEEWGVPETDDAKLFEKLVLEGFQSGLSWITILRKRENFRRAFHGFDAARVARYGARDVERLLGDAGIVRNRAKIEAAIANARACIALKKQTSLASFLWTIARSDGAATPARRETIRDIPAVTDVSNAMAKALKKEGFSFVGPTTMYAFMQSVGMVNDHLASCHRHAACAKLQRTFRPPER